jgi:putative intracellular protease/amidase
MKYQLQFVLRSIVLLGVFFLPTAGAAGAGYLSGMNLAMGTEDAVKVPPQLALPTPRAYDPTKPTVAILLSSHLTEVTDFLVPYELFSATDAFNVYGVAPQRQVTTLTGGLDVLPDYSLGDLDKLLGKAPDLIVIPAMPDLEDKDNQPTLDWLRKQASQHSQLFSICVGAEVLAYAGLLDGHHATTHWADIDRLAAQYPKVNWDRGLRYVDDGIISSAGVTSGIDAAFHIIVGRLGSAIAERIAQDLHYPTFNFVTDPHVTQYAPSVPDAIYLLNGAFGWNRATNAVLLYDGVSEIELASVFDTYSASFTTRTLALAPTRGWITTQHGLNLLPRYAATNAPRYDRLLVPGKSARQLAAPALASFPGSTPIYLHADVLDRFAFDAPLLDLARYQNVPTAQFGARRLEYRPQSLDFKGAGWPISFMLVPLLIGCTSVALFVILGHLVRQRSQRKLT